MIKAMVVDDENLTAEYICRLLRNAGVDAADYYTNPLKALEDVHRVKPDVVFLDIEMPEVSGLELAEKIMEKMPHVCIVFITAYNHFATEAFEVNAIDYILKPIREERLLGTLNKLSEKVPKKVNRKDNAELYIQAFGRLVLKAGDAALKWNRQKSAEVFACLLMNEGKWVNKEKVCDIIWPDYEPRKALAYLQTAMCQIRKTISVFSEGQIKIEYSENCYKLTLLDAFYDVERYEEFYRKATGGKSEGIEFMEKAFVLYGGKYLEEEGWLWSISYRETLDMKYRYLLERLIENSVKNKKWESLLDYMKALLERSDDSEALFLKYAPILNKVYGRDKTDAWRKAVLKDIVQ